MKNKNFGRKRQAIYILSNRKSTRIIKTLMDFFFFIKVKIKMVCFSVPSSCSPCWLIVLNDHSLYKTYNRSNFRQNYRCFLKFNSVLQFYTFYSIFQFFSSFFRNQFRIFVIYINFSECIPYFFDIFTQIKYKIKFIRNELKILISTESKKIIL